MSLISSYFDSIAGEWDSWELPHSQEKRKALVHSLSLRKGDKVLDVACGTGTLTELLAQEVNAPVLGIDISERMIEKAKENHSKNPMVSFVAQDFYTFEGEGYDAVILFNAYPHFLDVVRLGKAAFHALKRGGIWCILLDEGRNELQSYAAHRDPTLSRDIASPLEEALFYHDDFDVIEAKEDCHSYRLILRKK